MPSKGTTNQRGYGANHQRLRKQLEPFVRSGRAKCWRCGLPITRGMQWDLGHLGVQEGGDKSQYAGPEHARAADCPAGGNRATKGRGKTKSGAPHADTSREW